jgi:hypothetical protein
VVCNRSPEVSGRKDDDRRRFVMVIVRSGFQEGGKVMMVNEIRSRRWWSELQRGRDGPTEMVTGGGVLRRLMVVSG